MEGKSECRCADKGDDGEGDGMVQRGPVATLASWEAFQEAYDSLEKQEYEGEDRPCLDDDGVHLPVRILHVR